jgi:uncharacterized lipoprotein YajG
MMKRILIAGCAVLMASCAAPRTTVRTDDQSGSVVFKVKPSDATVTVDGTDVGRARDYDGSAKVLKLPPGAHIIRVSAPGRQDYETKVYVSDSQEFVQIELQELK